MKRLALAALAAATFWAGGAFAQSILKFHVGGETAPQVETLVDFFFPNDVGPHSSGETSAWTANNRNKFQPMSALIEAFAGDDAELRAQFRSDFYLGYTQRMQLAACENAAAPNVTIHTHWKPYEYDQAAFLEWLALNATHEDFLTPAARGANAYRGDLACPVGWWPPDRDSTSGLAIAVDQCGIVATVDNARNPLRWLAPINQIHHNESPSVGIVFGATPESLAITECLLAEALTGEHEQRIMLEYDLDLHFEDLADELGEHSIFDVLGDDPGAASDLLGLSYWNAAYYSKAGTSAGGVSLSSTERQIVESRLIARVEPPYFQLSIGVLWINSGAWRQTEFMLASRNYAQTILQDSAGFKVTADDVINAASFEGGNNGDVSWARTRIDAFASSVTNGVFHALPADEDADVNFHGTIDLTEYYRQARASDFFPGERGKWNGKWLGFEVCEPATGTNIAYCDLAETHRINTVALIYESHGAHKVSVKVNALNVYLEDVP